MPPHTETNRCRAVMFDLDGTLADTLAAIADAANHALSQVGRPPHPVNAYRQLAGQGLHWLMEHALGPDHLHLVEPAMALHQEHYREHADLTTRAYDGVPAMVSTLVDRDLTLAVLSNKPHEAVAPCVRHILPDTPFAAMQGVEPGGPLKPDPASALAIARHLGIESRQWVYVGDTRVDMLTGNAAGMYTVGVTWGFRDETELRNSGARAIIHHPEELLPLLDARAGEA
jgi:phosphoglycolate phosphatase